LKTQKGKKASRGEENDFDEENKMFFNLIFNAIKKDKPKHFSQVGLFPPPLFYSHYKSILSNLLTLRK
jgi:hypothetical protein